MQSDFFGGTDTVAIREGRLVLLRGCLVLRARESSTEDWTVTVGGNATVLGSSPSLAHPLEHPSVSRRHAVVERVGDGSFVVRDLGSLNGTFINDVGVLNAPLSVDQRLRLGGVEIELEPTERPEVVPLSDRESFGELVGRSLAMRAVYADAEILAGARVPVLILGETGTGKELCARAIHTEGARADGPFVVFDCAAAAESLIDSELFGHRRGAFTGARSDRVGLFEQANRGTLFLDEIGELPIGLQGRLLRAVDRGEFRRVGEGHDRKAEVRIVAATNRDLEQMVADGTFREDLLFRLRGSDIHMPPLRERVEDIPLLASAITRKLLGNDDTPFDSLFGEEVRRAMRRHPWPGNVRELRNWIARAVCLEGSFSIGELDMQLAAKTPPNIDWSAPFREVRSVWVQWFERQYLSRLLAGAEGNLSLASRRSGVDRKSLRSMVRKLGLKR